MLCKRCGFYCFDYSREDCPVCGTYYIIDAPEPKDKEEKDKNGISKA